MAKERRGERDTRESFERVLNVVLPTISGPPWVQMVVAKRCRRADAEHADSERQFCHVGHAPLTVCYADATEDLGINWKLGLALHEVGHLIAGGPGLSRRHTESDANEAAHGASGIAVEFRGPLVLEWSDARRVRAWLHDPEHPINWEWVKCRAREATAVMCQDCNWTAGVESLYSLAQMKSLHERERDHTVMYAKPGP